MYQKTVIPLTFMKMGGTHTESVLSRVESGLGSKAQECVAAGPASEGLTKAVICEERHARTLGDVSVVPVEGLSLWLGNL